MNKTQLIQIDIENWRFVLYEAPSKEWFGDFVYSPISVVDLSMLIKLSDDEKLKASKDRSFLIELSENIRNNHKTFLQRALDRELFILDK